MHERRERGERPEHVQDRLLFVEIQLREPPEGIAAQREAAAQRRTVHAQPAQRLDPGVLVFVRALLSIGVEVREQIDFARRRT